ncbi:MAG: hypothetical protein NT010_14545 [Proteobacteria bacterium]|jgi:hypothetical protein|nr:hypothetical protein [Pseudomonadota bacterium]
MGETFDTNLISQIHGLDKKFSISKEQPRLTRKITDEGKHRSRHYNEKKIMKNTDSYNDSDNFSVVEEDNRACIDITV